MSLLRTNIIQRENFGLIVSHETHGIEVKTEQFGFTVEVETMGFDATKLITGGSEADSYWLWGDGEWILWGDGPEMEL